jgi:putative ABC transport system ATP-binding protein
MGKTQDSPLIDLQNVTKCYETGAGDVTVLEDISLQVEQGQFVTIVGPSGSGKSTLLNMITGIDRPTEGEIFINGRAIHKMTEDQIAWWRGRQIGVIFQFFQLLPALTVVENVMLPMDFCQMYSRRQRNARALNLLEMVGIIEHAHKLPCELSGGQQQRAAIARSLANDPPLLIGDEPTGNLDTTTGDVVWGLFRQLVEQGKTLVIVTHDPSLSKQSDRVVRLIDGHLCNSTTEKSESFSNLKTGEKP